MNYVIVKDCPLCHSTKKDIFYKGTNINSEDKALDVSSYACTSSGYGRFPDIFQCEECDLIYSSKRPTPESLEDIYSKVEDELYLREEAGRVKTFQAALKDLNSFCPQRGKIFEIGSYTGVYLELARKAGWECQGAEFSAWARKVALEKRGVSLFSSIDEMSPIEKGTFDALVLWDVIEHVADPNTLVAKASELLKDGGVIGVSTMVLDSISAKFMKKKYPFLMEMHLLYFTRKTLENMLTLHGFEILSYRRHKRYVSLAYVAGKLPLVSFFLKYPAVKKVLQDHFICLSLGVRDIYARKKGSGV